MVTCILQSLRVLEQRSKQGDRHSRIIAWTLKTPDSRNRMHQQPLTLSEPADKNEIVNCGRTCQIIIYEKCNLVLAPGMTVQRPFKPYVLPTMLLAHGPVGITKSSIKRIKMHFTPRWMMPGNSLCGHSFLDPYQSEAAGWALLLMSQLTVPFVLPYISYPASGNMHLFAHHQYHITLRIIR